MARQKSLPDHSRLPEKPELNELRPPAPNRGARVAQVSSSGEQHPGDSGSHEGAGSSGKLPGRPGWGYWLGGRGFPRGQSVAGAAWAAQLAHRLHSHTEGVSSGNGAPGLKAGSQSSSLDVSLQDHKGRDGAGGGDTGISPGRRMRPQKGLSAFRAPRPMPTQDLRTSSPSPPSCFGDPNCASLSRQKPHLCEPQPPRCLPWADTRTKAFQAEGTLHLNFSSGGREPWPCGWFSSLH